MDLYEYQMQLARDGRFDEAARSLSYLLMDADISIDRNQRLRDIENITLELIKDGLLPAPVEDE